MTAFFLSFSLETVLCALSMVMSLFSVSRFLSINFCIKFLLSSHVSTSAFFVNPLNRRLFRQDLSSSSQVFRYHCWCFCSISLISSSIGLLAHISCKSLFASSNHFFWKFASVFKHSTFCLSIVFSLLSLSMLLLKNFINAFSSIASISFICSD